MDGFKGPLEPQRRLGRTMGLTKALQDKSFIGEFQSLCSQKNKLTFLSFKTPGFFHVGNHSGVSGTAKTYLVSVWAAEASVAASGCAGGLGWQEHLNKDPVAQRPGPLFLGPLRLSTRISTWVSWRDSAINKALALNAADLGSLPNTLYCPQDFQ